MKVLMLLMLALAPGRTAAGPEPEALWPAAREATARYRGAGRALFESSRPPLSGNGLTCAGCHPSLVPLVGVHARYPRYRRQDRRFVTLSVQVVECVTRRMEGTSPAGRELKALLMWLKELH